MQYKERPKGSERNINRKIPEELIDRFADEIGETLLQRLTAEDIADLCRANSLSLEQFKSLPVSERIDLLRKDIAEAEKDN